MSAEREQTKILQEFLPAGAAVSRLQKFDKLMNPQMKAIAECKEAIEGFKSNALRALGLTVVTGLAVTHPVEAKELANKVASGADKTVNLWAGGILGVLAIAKELKEVKGGGSSGKEVLANGIAGFWGGYLGVDVVKDLIVGQLTLNELARDSIFAISLYYIAKTVDLFAWGREGLAGLSANNSRAAQMAEIRRLVKDRYGINFKKRDAAEGRLRDMVINLPDGSQRSIASLTKDQLRELGIL